MMRLLHLTLIYYLLNQLFHQATCSLVAGRGDVPNQSDDVLHRASIPAFWNSMHPAISYLANYTVTHEAIQMLEARKSSNSTNFYATARISEFFDRATKLGRIVTQSGDSKSLVQETYIDVKGKSIYAFVPSTGNCKRINVVAGLLGGQNGFLEDNVDFDMGKLYGLAALWIKIQSLNGNLYLELSGGASNGMLTYSYENANLNYKLQMNFTTSNYCLRSVDFQPTDQSEVARNNLYRTVVNVESFTKKPNIKWELPKRCATLRDKLVDNFPRIGYLLEGDEGQMFIKSEIVISSTMGGEKSRRHTMDEWLHEGKLRLKTFGQPKGNNLDLLYFNRTRDVLDISKPYRCSNGWPRIKQLPPESSQVGFEEFWSGGANLVDDLSLLYYGPMSLWYLAERNSKHARLINTLDLAPLPMGDKSNIERELRTEKWTFTSPNKLNPLIFDLYFVQISGFSRDKKKIFRWHRLDRIELVDEETTIRINIINYRYRLREREIADKFKVPEGYLCRLSHDHLSEEHFDKLNLDLKLGYSMWYEASLEVLDDGAASEGDDYDEAGLSDMMMTNMRVTSSVSGRMINIHENNADISAHYQKISHTNGSSLANRFVHDRKSGLVYIEDQSRGSCEIKSFQGQTNIHDWVLQFFIGIRVETLILDEEMLQLLFTQVNNNYYASNRYHDESVRNWSIISYERELEQFPNKAQYNKYLNQGSQATIVRRYQERDLGSPGLCYNEGNCTFHLHDSMSVRVLLLDETRSRLRAVLSVSLRGATNIGLADALPDINVVKCSRLDTEHRKQYDSMKAGSLVRSFSLEYQVSGDDEVEEISQLSESFQRHVFVNSLLDNNLILPIQFDGWPTFEMDNQKGLMTVKFHLIEFPTAIEFPSKKLIGSSMSNELQSRAETRLLASLAECSAWCDQVGCIALAYCEDKTCSLLTLNMLREGSQQQNGGTTQRDSPEPEELDSISSCAVAGDCTYFIWTSTRPRSLNEFVGYMDDLINQRANSAELKSFILTPNTFTLVPTRFYEIKDDFELLDGSGDQVARVYKTVWFNRVVEPVKLRDLIEQDRSGEIDYNFDIKQSRDYAECLETCQALSCVAISHCKQKTTCLLITGKGDFRKLESALGPEMPDNLNCRVTILDYTEKYKRFSETQPPASSELVIDGYSALECASLCDSYDGSDGERKFKCLSYDLCHEVSPSSKQQKSVCYLQKSHVMLDSFDKSIMGKRPPDRGPAASNRSQGQVESREVTCEHYSKALLADYRRIANKRLVLAEGQVIWGSTADSCAIECHEDDRCWAFEHCFNDKLKPAQSCYLIRSPTTEEAKPFTELISGLEQNLTSSNTCSIYRLSSAKQRTRADRGLKLQPIHHTDTPLVRLAKLLELTCIASLSVFVGLLVQVGYEEVVKRRSRCDGRRLIGPDHLTQVS